MNPFNSNLLEISYSIKIDFSYDFNEFYVEVIDAHSQKKYVRLEFRFALSLDTALFLKLNRNKREQKYHFN